jgi:uncharacterized protein DUF6894
MIGRMPRYFFIMTFSDQREIDDPEGTRLPDDDAAIQYARRLIDDLNEDQLPGEPEPTIIVKNEAGEVVYRFPSN